MLELLASLIVLPVLLGAAWDGIGVELGSNEGESGEPATACVGRASAAHPAIVCPTVSMAAGLSRPTSSFVSYDPTRDPEGEILESTC